MAISNDWTNKSLKIQQEIEKAEAFQAGVNSVMMITNARQPNPEDPAYRDKQLNERYKQINNPKRPTEGQLLGESGGYLKDPETEEDISKPLQIKGMPPEINPDAHKKAQKKQKIYNKAADPEAKGAEKDWLKKTGAQLPNLIRTIKPKPQDVLKILQYLPALTGGGLGQMASSRSLREHLKPGTKGLKDYDKSGGGRGIPDDEWLELIRSAPKV
jgi:hypothetical protein